MTTFTTRLNLPRPQSTEPADGPDAFNDLTDALDPIIPPFAMGAIGVRPAPTKSGSLYYATDQGLLYFATGSDWITLNAPQTVDWKTGDMKFTGRDDLEAGWLWARGQAESRASYPDLFAEFGTRYGAGDGTTTFTMPDARGRVLVGVDAAGVAIPGATNLGDKGGAKDFKLLATHSGLPAHTPTATVGEGFETSGGADLGIGAPRTNAAPVAATPLTGSNVPGPASIGQPIAWWPPDLNCLRVLPHKHYVTVNQVPGQDAATPHPIVQPFCTVNVVVKV